MGTRAMLPVERVVELILVLCGQRVMLDADLARLYAVSTKRLNEQVKRNRSRFPADFMFQLTSEEKAEVVANCDHLRRLRFSPVLPYAFTEHGALMLAAVLNSPIAVAASVQIVRAFVRLRESWRRTGTWPASWKRWSGSTTRSSRSCSARSAAGPKPLTINVPAGAGRTAAAGFQ